MNFRITDPLLLPIIGVILNETKKDDFNSIKPTTSHDRTAKFKKL